MPPDNLPSELHLSHNRITPDGFHGLVQAIAIRHPEGMMPQGYLERRPLQCTAEQAGSAASKENKWARLTQKKPPVWLRVEGNAIDDATICVPGLSCQTSRSALPLCFVIASGCPLPRPSSRVGVLSWRRA